MGAQILMGPGVRTGCIPLSWLVLLKLLPVLVQQHQLLLPLPQPLLITPPSSPDYCKRYRGEHIM